MQTLQLKVIEIKPFENSSIVVTLRGRDEQPILYQAGQFITFLIDFHGKELRRSYSICSTPGVDDEIMILVKRVENGAISRFLIDHLQAGDILNALPPAGRFTLATNPAINRTVFFLAAGSGITPVYSLLKKLLFEEPLSRAILIYQNRSESTIIFNTELGLLQQQFNDRLTMVNLLSNPEQQNRRPLRLNNFLLESLLNQYFDINTVHDFFICGPLPFMRMIQFVLKLSGVEDEHIRKENFVIEPVPPAHFVLDTAARKVMVHWKEQVFNFMVSYPETILHAALRNDIHLPYSCKAGRCASCTLVCSSGKVKMSVNEVLTEKDLKEGLVLTCVGYAETDVVLELGS